MSAGEVCSFPCRWWISSARVGVCGTASVLIWEGPVLCVWQCVLECQVCIYQCVHRFWIPEGSSNLLWECLRSCSFAYLCVPCLCLNARGFCVMHMCRALSPKPPRHTLVRWSSESLRGEDFILVIRVQEDFMALADIFTWTMDCSVTTP